MRRVDDFPLSTCTMTFRISVGVCGQAATSLCPSFRVYFCVWRLHAPLRWQTHVTVINSFKATSPMLLAALCAVTVNWHLHEGSIMFYCVSLVNYPSRMTGNNEVLTTHSNKYCIIRRRFLSQHCYGNVTRIKVLLRHVLGGTEDNHDKLQSG
jgi:hypothetical protein